MRDALKPDLHMADPNSTKVRRHKAWYVLGFVGIAVAAWLLYAQVLDTGFWSPEDVGELRKIAEPGTLETFDFKPALSGGYPSNPIFVLEHKLFGMDAKPYYVVNLVVHILNAWLAYLLVISLLHDGPSSWMAALLFSIGVGSYGKNLMFATGISSLVYAMVCLVGTLFYVWNEQRNRGRPIGLYGGVYFAVLIVSLFMRGGSFSILASCVFYNFFFRAERQRPVLHHTLGISLAIVAVALAARMILGGQGTVGSVDPGAFLVNLPRYLVLMAFPMQQSELLESASWFVRGLHGLAPAIRVFVALGLLSYTIFGIVFGNRAIRFYIGWIYAMVIPFAVFRYPADWLNLRFLYLVSLGFCVLLVSGAVYVSRLLAHRGVRRYLGFAVPLFYLGLTVVLVAKLDAKNERLAEQLDLESLRFEALPQQE